MGDAAWWNKRFGDRSPELLKYDAKLFEDIDFFPRDGKVLDVACGDGRNAIFLSSRGYALDAIDFSEVAINRLQSFAENEQQHISTTQVDLSKETAFDFLSEYDLIIINHYRLDRNQYPHLSNHLKANGILWVNGFQKIPSNNPNISETDLLVDEDFEYLENCKLVNKDAYVNGVHELVRYIWKKEA